MKNYLVFGLGAAIGSLVTWRLVKSKYEQHAEDEIESVQEAYRELREKDREEAFEEGCKFMEIKMDSPVSNENIEKSKTESKKKKTTKKAKKKEEKPAVEETEEDGGLIKQNVFNYSNISKNEEKVVEAATPYVLMGTNGKDPAEEYEEFCDKGYDPIDLIYYEKDGVLADDTGQVIEDIENVTGSFFIGLFSRDNNLNNVYVVNHKRETVYDILREDEAYFDYKENPDGE